MRNFEAVKSFYYAFLLLGWLAINGLRQSTILQRLLSFIPLLKMSESLTNFLMVNECPFKSVSYFSYLTFSRLFILFAFEAMFVCLGLIISLGIKIARDRFK
mmetsp:Transcript_9214/g.10389  ORF Transcript_9214/g.10389 Transcript_9214/m.10389 type:complete len:102 (-) Transcript_9214:74-379(-)